MVGNSLNGSSQSYNFEDKYIWGFANTHEILINFIPKSKPPYGMYVDQKPKNNIYLDQLKGFTY